MRIASPFGLVRGEAWWFSKIPPLLALAMIQILARQLEPPAAFSRLAALLASAVAVAAWGFVVNDTFDVEADARAGKRNPMARLRPAERYFLCISLAAAGVVPWLFVRLDRTTAFSLAAIYVLLMAYAAPPVRLKERGILGPLADAAYAHALPALLTASLFASAPGALSSRSATTVTISSVVWSLLLGFRAILLHQVWDLPNDVAAGVTTLVRQLSSERVRAVVRRVLFPMELLSFGVFLALLEPLAPALVWAFLVYAVFDVLRLRYARPGAFDPLPAQAGPYVPLFDFYVVWMPLVLAAVLTARHRSFAVLLIVQVGFAKEISRCLSDVRFVLGALRRRALAGLRRRLRPAG